jgi:hypothetical protein
MASTTASAGERAAIHGVSGMVRPKLIDSIVRLYDWLETQYCPQSWNSADKRWRSCDGLNPIRSVLSS